MMISLNDMKGIGPARLEQLRAMGIHSLRDLLLFFPVAYDDLQTLYPCSTEVEGMIMVQGTITEKPKLSYFKGLSRLTARITDESGTLLLVWFNQPWMARNLKYGQNVRLYGHLVIKSGRKTLMNSNLITESGWIPKYRGLHGIPQKTFRKWIREALLEAERVLPENLDEAFRTEYRLCPISEALLQIHFPDSKENIIKANRRFAFEQMLNYLLYITRTGKDRKPAQPMPKCTQSLLEYIRSLPYSLTAAQKKALDEIANDLQNPFAMSRMVQGDVGCGKTAIAFGSLYMAFQNGFQSAMMAPTEILARQHYENALKTLEPLGAHCRLLLGSTRATERKIIFEELRSGRCNVLFGTHALISKGVEYLRLGLVITDEQHRFGVRQRTGLELKGVDDKEYSPHVLVMSATPIPRSLALVLYGDLDLSVVNEMPAGRIPVQTRIVPEEKRQDMYGFLSKEIKKGHQAYIVCPLVEEGEDEDPRKSAKTVFQNLQKGALRSFRLGLTWGGQSSDEKASVLSDFKNGKYDVLVSTTVIEVGVNNPNATIMVIENAERYGLSQLHQLRGRVGRGDQESWCFLCGKPTKRLQILRDTNDGFEVARKDLELRGPGDLAGTRQAGDPAGSLMINGDVKILEEVTQCVQKLHRKPEDRARLMRLEKNAEMVFGQKGMEIALN